jgi:hypothetical protein
LEVDACCAWSLKPDKTPFAVKGMQLEADEVVFNGLHLRWH